MTKIEELTSTATDLAPEQIEALLQLARSMRGPASYFSAPAEILAALDRGLAEIATGKTVDGTAVLDRIDKKLNALGA